jgi:ketosteroid isomerase-like protein
MTPDDTANSTVHRFVRAFEAGDLASLGDLLADDFVSHVTAADGGVRDLDRAHYLDAVRAMDVTSASLKLDVPTSVDVGAGRVLVMVEVHAQRGDAVLHNFSGQLATVVDGKLTELWMVEALPAVSERFWSDDPARPRR